MDATKLLQGLEAGLKAVETLAPLAKALGGPDIAAVAAMAASVASVGANVAKRIEEGKIVAGERDAKVIRAINTELALINDELAKHIAAS